MARGTGISTAHVTSESWAQAKGDTGWVLATESLLGDLG